MASMLTKPQQVMKPAAGGSAWGVSANQTAPDPGSAYAYPSGTMRGGYNWQHGTGGGQQVAGSNYTGNWRATGADSNGDTWQNTGKGRSGDAYHNQVASAGASAAAAPPPNPYGYASGPGILESWFNQRASGTDPGYEYAMNRGMNDIDSRMAAGGSYNSGARGQQLSDFAANLSAQREGQLDALAGGASGEYQARLNSMFGQGQALAGGQAGTASAYDLGAAGNMAAANQAQQQMALNSAAQQQQAHQGFANNLMNMYGLSRSGGGGGGSGYNANNPYPV